MKKLLITFVTIAIIFVGALVIFQKVNFNRVGAEEYYTQIKGEGKLIEDKIDSGEKIISYEYKLPAFDKDGRQKTLTFTAQKQLRENAYLILFVKDNKGVTSYQEVKKKELPKKASETLAK
ncbi:YxeA family protein [Siminovitchia fortis]|uniref:YxeA family protein n=1 Tax=Siminovitchia fortis TaxID=254758 RepID=UPI0011A0CC5F|nr:YxeA family protein [Siminovitchia fortis]